MTRYYDNIAKKQMEFKEYIIQWIFNNYKLPYYSWVTKQLDQEELNTFGSDLVWFSKIYDYTENVVKWELVT